MSDVFSADGNAGYPPELWRRVRSAYEGTEREIAEAKDSKAIRLSVLAERFGLHPNSISMRVKSRQWHRPTWYKQKAGPQEKRHYAKTMRLDKALTAFLTDLADTTAPVPSNFEMAQSLGTSHVVIVQALLRLKKAGTITVESHGNSRRVFVVATDKWTGRTVVGPACASNRPPAIEEEPLPADWRIFGVASVARRRRTVHDLLRSAAEQQEACPSVPRIAEQLNMTPRSAQRIIRDLEEAGKFTIERGRHQNLRRIVFPDGKATGWTSTANRFAGTAKATPPSPRPTQQPPRPRQKVAPPIVGGRIADAQRVLQRTGMVVFDRSVVIGGDPGRSYCADGRILDPDQLVALAERRAGAPA